MKISDLKPGQEFVFAGDTYRKIQDFSPSAFLYIIYSSVYFHEDGNYQFIQTSSFGRNPIITLKE